MQMSMQMSRGTKLDSILGPICPKLTQFVPFLTKNVNFHPVFLPFFGINWDIGPNLPLFNPNCEIFPPNSLTFLGINGGVWANFFLFNQKREVLPHIFSSISVNWDLLTHFSPFLNQKCKNSPPKSPLFHPDLEQLTKISVFSPPSLCRFAYGNEGGGAYRRGRRWGQPMRGRGRGRGDQPIGGGSAAEGRGRWAGLWAALPGAGGGA